MLDRLTGKGAIYLLITGRSGNAFIVPPTAFRPDQTVGDV